MFQRLKGTWILREHSTSRLIRVSDNWRVCLSRPRKKSIVINLSFYLHASATTFADERELRAKEIFRIYVRVGRIEVVEKAIWRSMYRSIFRREWLPSGKRGMSGVAEGENRSVKNASYSRVLIFMTVLYISQDLSSVFVLLLMLIYVRRNINSPLDSYLHLDPHLPTRAELFSARFRAPLIHTRHKLLGRDLTMRCVNYYAKGAERNHDNKTKYRSSWIFEEKGRG